MYEMNNDKEISFILCYNNPQYKKECCSYLEELEIPGGGYTIEIIPILGAKSIASAYNQGMQQTDAKYKIYLHQDVLIWNRRFIYDMLEIFDNSNIGMFGVLGGIDIPDDGVLYRAWNIGMAYACDTQDVGIKQGINPEPGTCREVEAIDGMLMVTQYDILWREDLFDGWDFYDISQSFEFRKHGYKVVVPFQEEPWCMHSCGRTKLQNYNQGRKVLLQEYRDFFKNPVYREDDFSYNKEMEGIYIRLKSEITQFMEQGDLKSAMQICKLYDDASVMDSGLSVVKKLASVCADEMNLYGICWAWKKGEAYEIAQGRYEQAKFLLWDAEHGRNRGKERLIEALQKDVYSMPLVVTVAIHNVYHFQELLLMFIEGAKLKKNLKELEYLEFIAKQIPDLSCYF